MFNTESKQYFSSSALGEPLDPITSHAKMVDMIGPGKRVLEFGCASGYMSRYLRDAGNHVTGIEVDAAAAQEARAFCDHVIEADLDMVSLDDLLPDAVFDVLAFGDVLEHLRDPWRVLDASRRLLAPGGYAVISIPNVAHGNVRLSLLRGSFEYEDLGLLDNTHLRFFTLRSVRELCVRAGYEVRQIERTKVSMFADSDVIPRVEERDFERDLIDRIRRDPEHDTLQFVIRAEPVSDGRRVLIALKALAETEIKLADTAARAERLEGELAGHVDTAERYAEIELFLAERIGEIERLKRDLAGAGAAVERCRELEATVAEQKLEIEEAERNHVERAAAFAREEELTVLLAEQRADLDRARADEAEARETLESLRVERAEFERQSAEFALQSAELERHAAELDERSAEVRRQAAELERQSAELADVGQRRALAEQALDELSAERSVLIQEIAALRARVDERDAEAERVRAETTGVRDAHSNVTSALAELRYEYDVLHAQVRALETERDAIVGRFAELEAQSVEREAAARATMAVLRSASVAEVGPRIQNTTSPPASFAVGALDAELQALQSVHRSTVDAFTGFIDSDLAVVRAQMAEIDAMIRQIQRSPAWRLKRAVGRLRLSIRGGRARV